MKIKAFLLDDEPKSIAILSSKIERFCPNITIVGSSQTPSEAIEMVERLQPDLVFLDIQMPEMSGFEFLSQFENPCFEVVFATAYDEHALEAIHHAAIGYILKPYDNDDLVKTVHRATESIQRKKSLEKNVQLLESLAVTKFVNQKVMIPNREGVLFIKNSEILYCEGEDGYTRVHLTSGKNELSSQSIGKFYEILPKHQFFQTHKSFVINLQFISKYLNEGYIILENDAKIPVSRQNRELLFSHLKNKS